MGTQPGVSWLCFLTVAGSLEPRRDQSFTVVAKDVSLLYLRQRLLKSAGFVCPRDVVTKKDSFELVLGL